MIESMQKVIEGDQNKMQINITKGFTDIEKQIKEL